MKEHMIENLWHYTTVDSAHSIIRSNSVWATATAFLNDKNELTQAIELFFEEIKQRNPRNIDTIIYESFTYHCKYLHYIFSMSTSPNVLSQWRAYGDDGYGLALNLSFDLTADNDVTLIPCLYENHDIAVKDITNRHWEDICKITADNSRAILSKIFPELLAIKNEHFSEEQEVRLIKSTHAKDAKTRVRDRLIIPYTTIPFRSCDTVVLGPKSSENNAMILKAVFGMTYEQVQRFDCGYK
ncbi:DUF2971 domain-containing protein [Vibrio sp. Isolate30]|uniref:DUF2971 domain-containing protein n=1 Tax=Vibrio sp. Isolate30 TaxID=2908536 RepID=UPI001EFDB263|nr:DUF2971 domain-containing protein [Vibrio sp. Isolate30]MCG9630142.1 DUF2971 domain-containing protein [Vibrio sp. Isolate30]